MKEKGRRRGVTGEDIVENIIILYILYISQDGGAVGFVEFTKLLFALSSLAQPLKRVRSIP